jgi:hypothetical protein
VVVLSQSIATVTGEISWRHPLQIQVETLVGWLLKTEKSQKSQTTGVTINVTLDVIAELEF